MHPLPSPVEIDALATKAIGLTLSELQNIYHVQLPVMRQGKTKTCYDGNNRFVFTPSSWLPGVRQSLMTTMDNASYTLTTPEDTKEDSTLGWEEVHNLQEGTVTRRGTNEPNTNPADPNERQILYHAPFDRAQREDNLRVFAWPKLRNRMDFKLPKKTLTSKGGFAVMAFCAVTFAYVALKTSWDSSIFAFTVEVVGGTLPTTIIAGAWIEADRRRSESSIQISDAAACSTKGVAP